MADLKNIVHDWLAQRHFDLMPADVRDRFDKNAKDGLFIGHMKKWDELYNGTPLVGLETAITDPADWEKLYDSCQKAFQGMNDAMANSVGYGSPYNGPTKDFIATWFGDERTKVFTGSKATSQVETLLKNLGAFLESKKAELKPRFIKELSYVFNGEMTYEKFYDKLKKGKFNDEVEFRDTVEAVIQYITTYGPVKGSEFPPDPTYWPTNLGYDMTGPVGPGGDPTVNFTDPVLQGLNNVAVAPNPNLDKDHPETWYEIPNKDKHIERFKAEYLNIFDKLLTNKTIRDKFLEKAVPPSVIRDALNYAISDTDYENTESDDYVAPDPLDEKNWQQKIKKWANDTYENHFRRFFEHHRGARKFFSPHSQNIMKAIDKVGVKPTDGIDGILAKKDDAKFKNVINQDGVTRKHFEWFAKTMEKIKEQIPDAYEGALRNGHQLRQVAMYVITMAAKDGEIAKAKTALEVLSVAKYGLTTSRTMNKIIDATKEMKLLNDSGYSWMKNENAAKIANAANATLGFGIRALGRIVTGTYNFIQHRRTKIGPDIRKRKPFKAGYEHLQKEYQAWEQRDSDKRAAQHESNVAYHVAGRLAGLDNPARPMGVTNQWYETNVQINSTNMGTADVPGPLRAALEAAVAAGSPTVALPGGGTVDTDKLQKDVELYDDLYERQQLELNDEKWREKNPDNIHDLVAYWDMLETYTKTHSFGLGSMKVKRDNFLKGWKDKNSEAQLQAAKFMEEYDTLRAA